MTVPGLMTDCTRINDCTRIKDWPCLLSVLAVLALSTGRACSLTSLRVFREFLIFRVSPCFPKCGCWDPARGGPDPYHGWVAVIDHVHPGPLPRVPSTGRTHEPPSARPRTTCLSGYPGFTVLLWTTVNTLLCHNPRLRAPPDSH